MSIINAESDYDSGYYIDKEPPEGSGDEDSEVMNPADALAEAKRLRERMEQCALLKVQAS